MNREILSANDLWNQPVVEPDVERVFERLSDSVRDCTDLKCNFDKYNLGLRKRAALYWFTEFIDIGGSINQAIYVAKRMINLQSQHRKSELEGQLRAVVVARRAYKSDDFESTPPGIAYSAVTRSIFLHS